MCRDGFLPLGVIPGRHRTSAVADVRMYSADFG
jgi:hypothetical protein